MGGGSVQADPAALEELSTRLRVTVEDTKRASEEAARKGDRIMAQLRHAVARRREGLRAATNELDRCSSDNNQEIAKCRSKAIRADDQLTTATVALRDAEETLSRYRAERINSVGRLMELKSQGVRLLTAKIGDLQRMNEIARREATGGSIAGPGRSKDGARQAEPTGSGFIGQVRTCPGLPQGFLLIPLGLIDVSSSTVQSEADFKKGYSPDDLSWSLQAFDEVILPGIAEGMTREDFIARDQRVGRSGTRSYSDTYQGFLGTNSADTIRLEPTGDGRYSIINGQHRIWVATRDGRASVPARVLT